MYSVHVILDRELGAKQPRIRNEFVYTQLLGLTFGPFSSFLQVFQLFLPLFGRSSTIHSISLSSRRSWPGRASTEFRYLIIHVADCLFKEDLLAGPTRWHRRDSVKRGTQNITTGFPLAHRKKCRFSDSSELHAPLQLIQSQSTRHRKLCSMRRGCGNFPQRRGSGEEVTRRRQRERRQRAKCAGCRSMRQVDIVSCSLEARGTWRASCGCS